MDKGKAKKRRKRVARALGLGGCDSCAPLSPFLSRTGSRRNTYQGPCSSCKRMLLLETKYDASPEILERFIKCVAGDKQACLHALTIKMDGEVTTEDPPCDCGKSRVVLEGRLTTSEDQDREAIKDEMVARLGERIEGLRLTSENESHGDEAQAPDR
jgi:hypothetical protein